jgi:5-formyltetrahydrofolate cyclo-ligase
MSDLPANSSKTDLRAAAIARRSAMSVEQRAAAAQAVVTRAFPVDVARGTIVSGYWPVRCEFDPLPLMHQLAAQGAQLALPVIMGREEPLIFRLWNDATQLLRGQIGIMEPSPLSPAVAPDIVLVPLAAFDRAGHRIGYGAGHYDRSFAQLRRSKPITSMGLAFATQEIDAVPALSHDVKLDYVLTEAGTLDFRS